MMRVCDVQGCDRKHKAKGLCARHYKAHLKAQDPEHYREYRRAYREANLEREKALNRAWREANREHVSAYYREWLWRNGRAYVYRPRKRKPAPARVFVDRPDESLSDYMARIRREYGIAGG